MAVRRTHTFYDEVGNKWRVDLHDTAFASTSTEMTLDYPGFTLSYKGEGDQRFEPIKSSECRVHLTVRNSIDFALINSIALSAEERYGIAVYKYLELADPTLYWAGHILPALVTIEDSPYPYSVELTATDGLGRLADVDFYESGTTPYTGLMTCDTILREVLEKLNVGEYWGGAANPTYVTAVNWYEDSHPAPAADEDPMVLSRVNANWVWEVQEKDGYIEVVKNDDGTDKVKTTLQVLEALCKAWGARILLTDGAYLFEQVNETDNTTLTYRAYGGGADTAWIAFGNAFNYSTASPRVTVDQSTVASLATGLNAFMPAIHKVKARRVHASQRNLISPPDLANNTNLTLANYGSVVVGAGKRVAISGNLYYHFIDTSGTLQLSHFVAAKILIKIDGATDYYLKGSNYSAIYGTNYPMPASPAAWTTVPSYYYAWIPNGFAAPSGSQNYSFWVSSPDLIPIDGVLSIEVVLIQDPISNNPTFSGVPATFTYRFTAFNARYHDPDQGNFSVVDVLNTTNGTDPTDDTSILDIGDVFLGDAIINQTLGGLEVSDGAITWTDAGAWSVAQAGTTYPMTELLCREVLADQKIPKRLLQGVIFGNINAWNALVYQSKVWILQGATLSAADGTWQGEWLESDKSRTLMLTTVNANVAMDEPPPPPIDPINVANSANVLGQTETMIAALAAIDEFIDIDDTTTTVACRVMGEGSLKDGDEVYLVNPYTGYYQLLTVATDTTPEDTTITFDEFTANADYPPGSYILRSNIELELKIAAVPQYWDRTGTELTPATAGDNVEVTSNAAQGAIKGITVDYYGVRGAASGEEITSTGVLGESTNGAGVRATSENYYALYAVSQNAEGAYIQGSIDHYGAYIGNASTSQATAQGTVVAVHGLSTTTGIAPTFVGIIISPEGTPEAGLGGKFVTSIQTDNGTNYDASRLVTKWLNVTTADRSATFEIHVTNVAIVNKVLGLLNTGQLVLDYYGDGTFTGDVTKFLAVTSAGAVVETDAPSFTDLWARTGTELTPTTAGDNVEVTSDASQGAIKGISTGYYGVIGTSTNGTGVQGISTNQTGVSGSGAIGVYGSGTSIGVNGISTESGYPGYFSNFRVANNTMTPCLVLNRSILYPTATVAAGIGASVKFMFNRPGVGDVAIGQLGIRASDIDVGEVASYYELYTYTANAETRKMMMAATGQLTLDYYGDNTFAGEAVKLLGVTADGLVVETDPSGGDFASKALDNLASVAINTSLISDTDNTDDLGSVSKKWANLFVTTIGATGTRVTNIWATDLTVTNAIAGSVTGNAGTVTNGVYTTGAGTVFEVPLTFGDGLTRTANDVDLDTTVNILKISGLTDNGFVKTSGGDGTLSVDTTTYITASSSDTLTNKSIDGDTNTLSDISFMSLKEGTTGQLITWAVDGEPAAVATGDAGQVLTSNGAGAVPTFQTKVFGLWQRSGTELTPLTAGDNVEVTSNDAQGAIKGISTDNSGIVGVSTNGYGGHFTGGAAGIWAYGARGVYASATGAGFAAVRAFSYAGMAFEGFSANYPFIQGGRGGTTAGGTSVSAVGTILEITNQHTDATEDGFGARLKFDLQSGASGGAVIESEIHFVITDVSEGLSEMNVLLDNAGTPVQKLSLKSTGALVLDEYGSGTFTGSVAKLLAVTSAGLVIETDPAGGTQVWTRSGTELIPTTDTDTIKLPAYGDGSVTGTLTRLLGVTTDGEVIEIDPATYTNYWQRTGTDVSPATAGDTVSIVSNDSDGTLVVTSTDYRAIQGISTGGLGVYGESSTLHAIYGSSGTGLGVYGLSVSGYGGKFEINPASTNTVVTALSVARSTSGAAANGIGVGIDFDVEGSNGLRTAAKIHALYTDKTYQSEAGKLIFKTADPTNTGIPGEVASLDSAGQLVLAKYGDLTFTGTPTSYVAADTNGNIIEVKAPQTLTGQTLAVGDWSLVGSFYELEFSNAAITATTIVTVIPDNADYALVLAAQILPRTDSAAGTVTLYAVNAPTDDIGVTMNLTHL